MINRNKMLLILVVFLIIIGCNSKKSKITDPFPWNDDQIFKTMEEPQVHPSQIRNQYNKVVKDARDNFEINWNKKHYDFIQNESQKKKQFISEQERKILSWRDNSPQEVAQNQVQQEQDKKKFYNQLAEERRLFELELQAQNRSFSLFLKEKRKKFEDALKEYYKKFELKSNSISNDRPDFNSK